MPKCPYYEKGLAKEDYIYSQKKIVCFQAENNNCPYKKGMSIPNLHPINDEETCILTICLTEGIIEESDLVRLAKSNQLEA